MVRPTCFISLTAPFLSTSSNHSISASVPSFKYLHLYHATASDREEKSTVVSSGLSDGTKPYIRNMASLVMPS